jgi:hypothetical protein
MLHIPPTTQLSRTITNRHHAPLDQFYGFLDSSHTTNGSHIKCTTLATAARKVAIVMVSNNLSFYESHGDAVIITRVGISGRFVPGDVHFYEEN